MILQYLNKQLRPTGEETGVSGATCHHGNGHVVREVETERLRLHADCPHILHQAVPLCSVCITRV